MNQSLDIERQFQNCSVLHIQLHMGAPRESWLATVATTQHVSFELEYAWPQQPDYGLHVKVAAADTREPSQISLSIQPTQVELQAAALAL